MATLALCSRAHTFLYTGINALVCYMLLLLLVEVDHFGEADESTAMDDLEVMATVDSPKDKLPDIEELTKTKTKKNK